MKVRMMIQVPHGSELYARTDFGCDRSFANPAILFEDLSRGREPRGRQASHYSIPRKI